MTVFILGNKDLAFDSLPLRILPKLKKAFQETRFEIKDPNEEWDMPPDELIMIDTVRGIKKVAVFEDLKSFIPAPRVTLHDFDAFAHLRLLEKLGELPKIKIIGVPETLSENEAFNGAASALRRIIRKHNAKKADTS